MKQRNQIQMSEEEIKEFKKTISAENKKNNGDTAAFYLKKKNWYN